MEKKEEKVRPYYKVILVTISLLLFVAWVDLTLSYPNLFYAFTYFIGFVAGLVYYLLTKDLSDSLAISLSYTVMYLFGLEDLLFYLLKFNIPASMPHLYENFTIMGLFAKLFGLETVTPFVLIYSVFVGFVISLFVVTWLKKQKW